MSTNLEVFFVWYENKSPAGHVSFRSSKGGAVETDQKLRDPGR